MPKTTSPVFTRDSSYKPGSSPSRREEYFQRPLAPAPKKVLVGVSVLAVILLAGASLFENDFVAAFGCFLVLGSGAAVFDYTGRKKAAKNPDPIYKNNSLPSEKSSLKPILVGIVLFSLAVYASKTATPNDFGSPFPYFLATAFLFLVMPQMVAYRTIRKAKGAKAPETNKAQFRR